MHKDAHDEHVAPQLAAFAGPPAEKTAPGPLTKPVIHK